MKRLILPLLLTVALTSCGGDAPPPSNSTPDAVTTTGDTGGREQHPEQGSGTAPPTSPSGNTQQ